MSNKQRTTIIAGVSIVVIIGLVLLFVSLRAQASGGSGTSAYQTTTVQRGTLTATVEGTGTVTSLLSANLAWLAPTLSRPATILARFGANGPWLGPN